MSQDNSKNISEKNLVLESLQDKINFLTDSLNKSSDEIERSRLQTQIASLKIALAKQLKPQ
jgi:hypothetical protein